MRQFAGSPPGLVAFFGLAALALVPAIAAHVWYFGPGLVFNLLVAAIFAVARNTFHEAVRLSRGWPQSTEEAQYSLPYPLAAALTHGRLGVSELTGTLQLNKPWK